MPAMFVLAPSPKWGFEGAAVHVREGGCFSWLSSGL